MSNILERMTQGRRNNNDSRMRGNCQLDEGTDKDRLGTWSQGVWSQGAVTPPFLAGTRTIAGCCSRNQC